MGDYEQIEMDLTLLGDRVLKDNMQNVAKFALGQFIREKDPDGVKNRHEGYGIAAEYFDALQGCNKAVGTEMKALLSILPNSDGEFLNFCGSLYNSAIDTACAAIKLASQAQRIMTDLYDDSPSPIEEYADSVDNDGFEEAEANTEEEVTEDGEE